MSSYRPEVDIVKAAPAHTCLSQTPNITSIQITVALAIIVRSVEVVEFNRKDIVCTMYHLALY